MASAGGAASASLNLRAEGPDCGWLPSTYLYSPGERHPRHLSATLELRAS